MKGFKSLLLIMAGMLCLLSCNNTGKSSGVVKEDVQEDPEITAHLNENAEEVIDDRGYIVKVGDYAPDFTIEYLDGSTKQLSELRGKLVMLQFTASWCGVCRKEMPFIESDIWSKHKNNPNFALIGIDLKEDKKTTAEFAEKMKVTYPITLDPEGEKFALYTAPKAGVTRNIIIDKDGKIVFLTRLFETEEFNGMVKFIDNYLKNNF